MVKIRGSTRELVVLKTSEEFSLGLMLCMRSDYSRDPEKGLGLYCKPWQGGKLGHTIVYLYKKKNEAFIMDLNHYLEFYISKMFLLSS